jgi:hypothetical protein
MALSEFICPDLSQIEKRLGSFSNDSVSYIKKFKYLTQAYDMTWHETHLPRMEQLFSTLIFISQSFPDIQRKLKQAEGALKPSRESL